MTRYQLPDTSDLRRLGEPHEVALTVYVQTSPAPDQRSTAQVSAKSSIDRLLRDVRTRGVSPTIEQRLRQHWSDIAESDVWLRLSRSLAIFIADDFHEVYVLPNALLNQDQAGAYFDIGQLVRAVTTPQQAYGVTLSAGGWRLWEATPTSRATEMTLTGDHPVDVADATNRSADGDRDHVRRLIGDEGRKVLLETYAKRVSDAVETELGHVDPAAQHPLFVFAAEPLLSIFGGLDTKRAVVSVPGAADDLRPDQIDATMRKALAERNSAHVNSLLEEIGDGVARGLVAADLVDIGRAAVAGAVSVLIYDFTVDVMGRFNDANGRVSYDDGGYDLLSRIAIAVLDKGGDVVAVRSDEITADIWSGTAVAGLRFPLS